MRLHVIWLEDPGVLGGGCWAIAKNNGHLMLIAAEKGRNERVLKQLKSIVEHGTNGLRTTIPVGSRLTSAKRNDQREGRRPCSVGAGAVDGRRGQGAGGPERRQAVRAVAGCRMGRSLGSSLSATRVRES
jgi:hypothetical protein